MMKQAKEIKNTPFRRVKYLSLMQMGEQLRAKKTRTGKVKAFITFLKGCITIAVTAVMIFLLSFLNGTFKVQPSKEMFTTFILFTQIVTLLSCMGSMMSVLYTSKDNTMLLAFPCTYGEIFLSRLAVFSINELKKSAYFLVPILLAFGIQVGGVAYWLMLIPMWAVLCLLPVFISALLSVPFIYLKRFLDKYTSVYIALIALVIAGLFVGVTIILKTLPDPLRLVAMYGKFIKKLEGAFASVYKYSLWYSFIAAAMYGEAVYWTLPAALGVFAGFGFACFLVVRPFYFKAVSSTVEAGRTKKHKQRHHKHNNLFLTFFRKELKLFFRNSQSVTSSVTTILIFPLISYVFNFLLIIINKNAFGDFMSIAFNLMITLSVLSANNAQAAAAISSEGSEFAVLKTAPSDTSLVCWAKIAVTILVNLVAMAATFVMLAIITDLSVVNLTLMALLLIILTTAHIMWSFQLDINNPRILDYAQKGNNVVDNVNIGKAILIGFIAATIIGVLSLLLLIDTTIVSGWIRLFAIAIAFLVARFYLLRRNIKVYFNDIQM